MCGIAGIIHRGNDEAEVGGELTSMLQALKHRGPDSTGFALYGRSVSNRIILRLKLADPSDVGFGDNEELERRKEEVEGRILKMDGKEWVIG